MKKIISHLLLLFVAVFALASCEKDEPDFRITPQTQIVFDDAIDKATADYKLGSNVVLKISAPGATSVQIRSTYSGGSKDLGTLPVNDGVATLNITPATLRASGTVLGASNNAPSSTRAANTFTLRVDATTPDGVVTRYYTAVIVR